MTTNRQNLDGALCNYISRPRRVVQQSALSEIHVLAEIHDLYRRLSIFALGNNGLHKKNGWGRNLLVPPRLKDTNTKKKLKSEKDNAHFHEI